MNQSKKVTEGALLVTIFIILMLVTLLVPILFLPAMALLPVPFIIYAYKYNWRPALMMYGVAILLAMIFVPFYSLPVTVFVGVGGIMLGSGINQKLSAYETLARGTIGYVIGLIFVFIFTQFILDINWATEIDLLLKESLEMSKEIMGQFGMNDQTNEAFVLFEERLALIKDLIPVGIAIIAIVMAFLSQWFSYKIINRMDRTTLKFPLFRNLRLPVAIVWFYFIAIVSMLFMDDPTDSVFIAANNVLSLTGLFMGLQGFSFMFFYAHHRKWSKGWPIFGVIITLIFPLILFYFVRILGIIDIGFRMRDRLNKKGS